MTYRRTVLATILALTVSLRVGPSGAQELVTAGGFFRAEWGVPPLPHSLTKIEGYIYNDSRLRVTDVRLRVVSHDSAGRAVGETLGWVFGDIPPGGRGYFAVPLAKPAATYGVTVISFDVVSEGGE
jgi:hypothetical protein